MASKKLIIGLVLVAGVAYYAFGRKKTDTGTAGGADGTDGPKTLSDAQALAYLNNNPDLLAEFGAGNIAKARWHYEIVGWTENRWKP